VRRHPNPPLEFRAPRARPRAGLLLLAALAGCGGGGSTLVVVNRSLARLDRLRVCAERDSTQVPPLAPGDSARVRPPWRDDDMIQLRGRIGGEPLRPMMSGYVEAGDRVRVAVDASGFVTVETRSSARR